MDKNFANQAQTQNYAGIANAKPPQPAISSLFEAVKYMREATSNVRTMVDQLCGSQPEAVSSGETAPQSVNLFSQIEDLAGEIRAMAARVSTDVQRVQNRL